MFIASILTELDGLGQDVDVTNTSPTLPRRLLAEFLGTGLLVTVIVGSEAHFNPVASLADWFLGRRTRAGLTMREVGAYTVAQCVGGTGGALLANAMFEVGQHLSAKDRTSGGHLLGEVVATAGLLMVIFALVRTRRGLLAAPAVGAHIGAA